MTQKSFDLVRDARQKTLLVAHRGISGGNIPCNTIAAFDLRSCDIITVLSCVRDRISHSSES